MPQYEFIDDFGIVGSGLALVRKEGKYSMINRRGELIQK
jgi:hypothetical protein